MTYQSNKQYTITDSTPIILDIPYTDVKRPSIAYELQRSIVEPGFVKVHLYDGYVIMFSSDLVFHLLTWRILLAFDLEITTEHIFKRLRFSRGGIAKLETKFVRYIRKHRPETTRNEINEVLFNFINYLYNFVYSELTSYAQSISIQGLATLMNHPEIKAIRTIPYRKALGTDVLEKKIAHATKDLVSVLTDPDVIHPDDNQLFYYLKTDQININQLAQIMIMYGPRTDVDDTLIMHPALGNAIEGLKTIEDVVVDSLSAKKSAFYQKISVADSQYMGRKQHILTSSLLRTYPGDCGSSVLLPFTVTESNRRSLIGVYMLDENTRQLVPISEELVTVLIGSTIHIRNPITCRHTDGFCSVCGGELMFNIDPKYLIGILSAIQYVDPTTQKILSAKHLVKTCSIMYELNKDASKYFLRIKSNEIHWNQRGLKKLPYLEMGISMRDISSLHDILTLNVENEVRIERYSTIRKVLLRDTRSGTVEEFDMGYNDLYPSFTVDMLVYIRNWLRDNNPDTSNVMWIPMVDSNKFSLFTTIVINDSMMKYLKSLANFLSKDIRSFTDASAALMHFCELIFSKVPYVHITHLSSILKSYLVTSDVDFRIPVVNDPHNVIFDVIGNIVSSRTLGGQFAYEEQSKFIYTPDSYLIPRVGSVFDRFVGVVDIEQPVTKKLVDIPDSYIEYSDILQA